MRAQAMTDGVARRHAQLVADVRAVLTVTAQLPRLIDEPAYCTALMQRLLTSDQAFANLGVVAVDGRVLCSALPFREGLNLGDRGYFRRALETRSFAAGTYSDRTHHRRAGHQFRSAGHRRRRPGAGGGFRRHRQPVAG